MYFWNIEKLNKDLKKGLTEKEDLKYLLAYILIGSTLLFMPTQLNIYGIISSAITVFINIIWIILFYRINWWANGKNFLSIYFSIWIVTLIRSTVFILLPLFIAFLFLIWIVYWDNIPLEATIYDVIFYSLYMIFYVYLNLKYLKKLINK